MTANGASSSLEEVGELTLKGLTQPIVAYNDNAESRLDGRERHEPAGKR
jgi:hypothetical protein